MRHVLIGLSLLVLGWATPAAAQLSIDFASPGVQIGINVPVYPTLQRIPGYPVYYAPGLPTNYFFYDGLYWVFDGENWYESSWYNGPWYLVDPFDVPVFLLRVPVRYYHHAPGYFRGWAADAPPHWGERWGRSWESRRSGWDRWNRASAPAPAPLPTYQRQYSGSRYPRQLAQQAAIQTRSYHYQPKDNVARTHFQEQRTQARSAPQARSSARGQAAATAHAAPQQHAAPARHDVTAQPAQPAQQRERTQQAQQRERTQQAQQRERTQQAQQRERTQQAQQRERTQQAQQHERAQQAQPQRHEQAQQARNAQQEHAGQARPQPEQHARQATHAAQPQHAERGAHEGQPGEKGQEKGRGEDRGKGRDKEG